MKKIKIAVLGLGNVGQGVVMMLQAQREQKGPPVWRAAGEPELEIELAWVLEKYLTKKREVQLPEGLCTSRWEDILEDPSVDIVVEAIGGTEPARTYLLQALEAGKSVVTANKELLARHGAELFRAAVKAKRDLYFESSVGGAMPVIGALRKNLSVCRLTQVMGIINSTTNYILARMEEGGTFARAAQEARDLGITETDIQQDIDGFDAARNAAILATLAFHTRVSAGDVYTEGIGGVTGEDITIAGSLGYTVKLLAVCRVNGGMIEARVYPALIPFGHPLASVRGVYNAIFIEGEDLGETMFYGPGAGRMPAAGAILNDVTVVARNIRDGCQGRLNILTDRVMPIMPAEKSRTRFFLRILVDDEPGSLAGVTEIFGRCQVSIARVNQSILDDDMVFITHPAAEGDMQKAVNLIRALPVVKKVSSLLRVEGNHR